MELHGPEVLADLALGALIVSLLVLGLEIIRYVHRRRMVSKVSLIVRLVWKWRNDDDL